MAVHPGWINPKMINETQQLRDSHSKMADAFHEMQMRVYEEWRGGKISDQAMERIIKSPQTIRNAYARRAREQRQARIRKNERE